MDYRKIIYKNYITLNKTILTFSENKIKSSLIWYKKQIIPIFPKNKEVKILELGCGVGVFLKLLKERGYKNITGVEIGSEQLEIARQIGIEKFIVNEDIFAFLKKESEFYDVICAFDVLEHFYKDELFELVELIFKCLKKDGIFIFRTPNGESPFSGRLRYGDLTHEIVFTRSSLLQLFKVVGFSECEFYPCKPVVHGLKSFVRRVIYELYDFFFRLFLIAETGALRENFIFTQNLWGIARK